MADRRRARHVPARVVPLLVVPLLVVALLVLAAATGGDEGSGGGGGGPSFEGILLLLVGIVVAAAAALAVGYVILRWRAGPPAAEIPGEWWTCRSCGAANIAGSPRCHACGAWPR